MLYEAMSEMFRDLLDEDSTAMDAMRGSPYADQLVKAMHKGMAIPHDVHWIATDKVSWNDIKERSPNYVLVTGKEGTAAIRYIGGGYEALVSYNEGITQHSNNSSTGIMSYVKAGIGKITGYFEAWGQGKKNTWGRRATGGRSEVDDLRKERASARKITKSNIFDPSADHNQNFSTLMNKLKPIYVKALDAAIADLKGAAAIALKNDAYDKAIGKINHINSLDSHRESLLVDPTAKVPDYITTAMRHAIFMASAYYYPEETGELTRGGTYMQPRSENKVGPTRVINDISKGDQEKLSTIMAFFKQDLLHKQ